MNHSFSFCPNAARPALSADQQLRESVLLSFLDPRPAQVQMLRSLSHRQWKKLIHWLDVSGLALYFFHRIEEQHCLHWLPLFVEARLRQNLADNTKRSRAMLEECVEIQKDFQHAHLSYVLLKGFSLAPCSVPYPQLRSQLDLDFLIAPGDVKAARTILEQRGYLLHAAGGRSYEFKTADLPSGSIRDLYKDRPARCVELHLEAAPEGPGPHIAGAEWRAIQGFEMPVLAPVDLFLGQAVHLYKHVSTGTFRCSHLLEFSRHALAKESDMLFWNEVNEAATNNERAQIALGVIGLLCEDVLGRPAPHKLLPYMAELCLPVRLWVALYGRRCVYAGFPGNKFYLLLQRELAQGNAAAQASIRRLLVPLRFPPAISQAIAGEPLSRRARRFVQQCRFLFFRLQFHTIEGLRYAWELHGWRQQLRTIAPATTELKGEPEIQVQRGGAPALRTRSGQNKGMTIL